MQFLISSLLGYIFGSIPTAYLTLRKSNGIDITVTGSGNVGAMNSYEITGSKKIGFVVFLIDFLKGIISVLAVRLIFGDIFIYAALSVFFSILSHCFNPWLNFKGGRGLATAAGGSIILFPYLLAVWIILWVAVYLIKKDILFANIFSTILSLIIIFITYEIAFQYAYPEPASAGELMVLSASVLVIIFIKHIEPLKEIFLNKTKIKS